MPRHRQARPSSFGRGCADGLHDCLGIDFDTEKSNMRADIAPAVPPPAEHRWTHIVGIERLLPYRRNLPYIHRPSLAGTDQMLKGIIRVKCDGLLSLNGLRRAVQR